MLRDNELAELQKELKLPTGNAQVLCMRRHRSGKMALVDVENYRSLILHVVLRRNGFNIVQAVSRYIAFMLGDFDLNHFMGLLEASYVE